MARGQKHNDDIKEKARALLVADNNVSRVAKALGIPRSTIKSWKESFERESEQGTDDFAELRHKKKESFVNNAWDIIKQSQTLLARRLNRAIESENEIDALVEEITKLDHKQLTDTQRKALYSRITAIKVESVKEIAVVLGTLYDKQALAANEATQNVGGSVVMKWEDFA